MIPGIPITYLPTLLGEIRLSELRSVLTDGKISSRSLRPSKHPPREITFDHANRTGNVDIGKSTKSDSWKWAYSENRTSPEGGNGARSGMGTRIRARTRFENYVLADAARRDPSIRIKICLSGRKDRFGITKTIEKPTTRNYF